MSKNNYVVYMHTTPNNKRYIGITSKSPIIRWRSDGSGYNTQLFWRAIQKYGWDNIKHEILFTNLSKEDAKNKEVELIAKYKSDSPLYGYNQTKGGDYARCGVTTSAKQKEVASRNWIGSKNPRAKKVICLETLKIYETAVEAKKDTGASKIMDCCKRNNKHRTSGNYHWAYYDETKPLSYYWTLLGKYIYEESQPPNINKEARKRLAMKQSKPVICLETGIIYSSLHKAEQETGINISLICNCCNGKSKTAKGYHWQYMNRGKVL